MAYDGMERFFPAPKIRFTGNPVRQVFVDISRHVTEAKKLFHIETTKVLLVTGGSLGARTINDAVLKGLPSLEKEDITLIWQTGSLYLDEMKRKTKGMLSHKVQLYDFIAHMDLAFAASDLIISRAGAITLAEIAVAGKPSVLVPSPNVAEDHQTKNAMALVQKGAAIMIPDTEAKDRLMGESLKLIKQKEQLEKLSAASKILGIPDAERKIVDEVFELLN